MRSHDNVRPYACDSVGCGKTFTRSDELRRHQRIHLDERSFACPLCPKRFLRSDHLSKHLLIHSKAAPSRSSVLQVSAANLAEIQKMTRKSAGSNKIREILAEKSQQADTNMDRAATNSNVIDGSLTDAFVYYSFFV
jgi:uncharacterized Zn-finger protein